MTTKHDTNRTPMPVCPHCGHEFDVDDMNHSGADLWALAPDEGLAAVECPSCSKDFHVRGGYTPFYITAINEDDPDL